MFSGARSRLPPGPLGVWPSTADAVNAPSVRGGPGTPQRSCPRCGSRRGACRRTGRAGRHPAPADPYVSPHRGHRWYSGQRDHGHDPARVDSPRWWRDTPTCFAYRTKSLSDAKMAIPLDAAAAQIRKSVCGPWTPALRHIYRRGLSPARSGLLVVVVSIVIHFPEERGDLEIRGHIPPPRRT